jgi:hypothetical protein
MAKNNPEPVFIPDSAFYGKDPGGGVFSVVRGCSTNEMRWCAYPPAGETQCESPCPVGGKHLVFTKR